MEVEGPSLSRTGPAMYKGKDMASSVHLFRGIHKKPRKKRSIMQEMSNFLKKVSDVIVECRSVSTHTSFASIATVEVQVVMDMGVKFS